MFNFFQTSRTPGSPWGAFGGPQGPWGPPPNRVPQMSTFQQLFEYSTFLDKYLDITSKKTRPPRPWGQFWPFWRVF